ncbi:MAG: bifunctional oligoribonuclease/PAP phosphatase NrnA [Ignavibacteriaceae bacterium]
MDFQILKKIIEENKSFLLTTHVNPDADAIGSEIAMYKILKALGKHVQIINHSSTPFNLEFFDPDNIILKFDEARDKKVFDETDVLIALDFNRTNRMVSMQKIFSDSNKIKVCIDHHQDPEDFVDHYFIDDQYSSTGHIICDFIEQTELVDLSYEIAYPLYAAIMTDTGSFRFEKTSSELHKIIARLLETGVDPVEVYDKIYDQSKISKIKLLGRSLDSLKLIDSDRIGYMNILQSTFIELGAFESDTENFVNYPLSIENVVLSLLFIELKDGFKVSFRSKGNIPVNKIAANFGGGGHTNAAGARFHDSKMNDEMPKILNFTIEFFNNYSQEENV